jgi:hypothetical protein
MNPTELLAERQRDYGKALDRHLRALEQWRIAQERVQGLERELAEAEGVDRLALGEALVDGAKPPARKADRARTAVQKAKSELEALQYAAERAGEVLDRMPVERRSEWLRQARDDFQEARTKYEEALARFVQLREQLAQEAALLSFLIDGQETAVRMAHTVRVLVGGVDGLAKEVPTQDVLEALRDEVVQLEASMLIASLAPNK